MLESIDEDEVMGLQRAIGKMYLKLGEVLKTEDLGEWEDSDTKRVVEEARDALNLAFIKMIHVSDQISYCRELQPCSFKEKIGD